MVTLLHTAQLDAGRLAAVRALMDASFDDFTDHDWDHGLGGMHALVEQDAALVAHGSLVQRRAWTAGRALRVGYVESVAVAAGHRRLGHGHTVMAALESLAPAYDLLALSASDAGSALYLSRGWRLWRGPTGVLGPHGPERTADEDGSVHVLGGVDLDLDERIDCDWRPGDVW